MLIKVLLFLLKIVSEGIALYIFLWALRRILSGRFRKKGREEIFLFYYQLITLIWWMIFVVYAVILASFIFTRSVAIVAILILLLGYRFFMNLVLGIIYRFQHGNQTGQKISVADTEGSVDTYTDTYVVLRQANGNLRKIPYAELYSMMITLPSMSEKDTGKQIVLQGKSYMKYEHRLDEMKRKILLLPEIAVRGEVRISYTLIGGEPTITVEYHVNDVSQNKAVGEKIKVLFN